MQYSRHLVLQKGHLLHLAFEPFHLHFRDLIRYSIQRFRSLGFVSNLLPKPYPYSFCACVNCTHSSHLFRSLYDIGLINAQCIDPNGEAFLIGMKTYQSSLKLTADVHFMPINSNLPGSSRPARGTIHIFVITVVYNNENHRSNSDICAA
jgi:hypothetical protein